MTGSDSKTPSEACGIETKGDKKTVKICVAGINFWTEIMVHEKLNEQSCPQLWEVKWCVLCLLCPIMWQWLYSKTLEFVLVAR